MRKDELVEMMSIWINTTTLSNDTKANACAKVAEEYHAEQLRLAKPNVTFNEICKMEFENWRKDNCTIDEDGTYLYNGIKYWKSNLHFKWLKDMGVRNQ